MFSDKGWPSILLIKIGDMALVTTEWTFTVQESVTIIALDAICAKCNKNSPETNKHCHRETQKTLPPTTVTKAPTNVGQNPVIHIQSKNVGTSKCWSPATGWQKAAKECCHQQTLPKTESVSCVLANKRWHQQTLPRVSQQMLAPTNVAPRPSHAVSRVLANRRWH
ncbi:C6 [callitrichine gammaherpesvirus 3]|uniref:C6 n=1 Tax=callitrichine gammaherpesvirus 3 TaxID=106331 RepID=Q8BEM9_9GAMA|nr:C6 [callitrichine gammaherpesvirus 3]AAN64288.1 C6 [callitrichine gammaherpesvirus 3]